MSILLIVGSFAVFTQWYQLKRYRIYFLAIQLHVVQLKAPWMARLEHENKYGSA